MTVLVFPGWVYSPFILPASIGESIKGVIISVDAKDSQGVCGQCPAEVVVVVDTAFVEHVLPAGLQSMHQTEVAGNKHIDHSIEAHLEAGGEQPVVLESNRKCMEGVQAGVECTAVVGTVE